MEKNIWLVVLAGDERVFEETAASGSYIQVAVRKFRRYGILPEHIVVLVRDEDHAILAQKHLFNMMVLNNIRSLADDALEYSAVNAARFFAEDLGRQYPDALAICIDPMLTTRAEWTDYRPIEAACQIAADDEKIVTMTARSANSLGNQESGKCAMCDVGIYVFRTGVCNKILQTADDKGASHLDLGEFFRERSARTLAEYQLSDWRPCLSGY